MELKWGKTALTRQSARRSNCTFMELKCQVGNGGGGGVLVLIVPLWN